MMKISSLKTKPQSNELVVLAVTTKQSGKKSVTNQKSWPKDVLTQLKKAPGSKHFNGAKGETLTLHIANTPYLLWGFGDEAKIDLETIRKEIAKITKAVQKKAIKVSVIIDSLLNAQSLEGVASAAAESYFMTRYQFDKYKTVKSKEPLKEIILEGKATPAMITKAKKQISDAKIQAEAVNFARDLVNEAPNVLNSVHFAKVVQDDAKKLKGVKTKVLGRAELKKEKMNLFLSVNAGSAYEPKLVHLTYTPAKATSKTKHIALVGKGLTFDTGGYSLKPSASIRGMKADMGGAATVYGAFRAMVQKNPKIKISCFLGMTDNAVSSKATLPDSIIKARNGKTVEILNTDAEGRLVMADVLDYACDQKPNCIIDAATLTGACLVALGSEICAVLGNDRELNQSLLNAACEKGEHMWELPIIQEFKEDIKSPIADLKNIGGSRFGGTSKAAAFLEEFIKNDTSWAHLDIAGVATDQSHLPYCPSKGGSGLIIRSLVRFMENEQ